MDAAARAAGIAEVDDPTADHPRQIPNGDAELGMSRKSENNSRASLPSSHQRSFSMTSKYAQNGTNGHAAGQRRDSDAAAGAEMGEHDEDRVDLPWDASHPCWPHTNVHQPLNSALYNSTRIIRVKRDWTVAGDLAPTFSALYPEILEPLLSQSHFRDLITHINNELIRIFNPYGFRAWLDAGLGLATGWLWDDLGLTGAKKDLAKLEKWIQDWNHEHGKPPEFEIIPLRRTAYLNLDIQIPDPEVGPDVEQTDFDTRSNGGSHAFNSSRNLSVRRPNSTGRSPAGAARSDYTPSSVGRPIDDGAYGAYPVVPAIPGKYLEEAQRSVSRQGTPRTPVTGEHAATTA